MTLRAAAGVLPSMEDTHSAHIFKEAAMVFTPVRSELSEHYLKILVEATFPLQQQSLDPEVTLHALIDAAGMLKERFEQELEELRQEAD